MPRSLSSAHSFGAIFQRLQQPVGDPVTARQDSTRLAQLALQVEFSTIPVYLSGMYSISDKASTAYQALRTVVMEEMFHLNQAANLVVALGGLPRLTGDAAPVYPGYLPQANQNTTPLLGLFRASPQVFESVYSAIESPAPAGAPAQGDQYDSIAQLYEALVAALHRYESARIDSFCPPATEGRQRTDIYLGKFGGTVIEVTDIASALRGIEQIVQQGEGVVPARSPLVPTEPFGAYNHYGQRTDGTYGPILGTPLELSHFSRFRQVAMSPLPFPATLPIVSNPREADYSNPAAQALSQAFNGAYSVMLRAFEMSFRTGPDPYFGLVLDLMHQVLPQLALSLMTTPALQGGDATVGPTAAPTWSYLDDVPLSQVDQQMQRLGRSPVPGLPKVAQDSLRQALDGWKRLVIPATPC